MDPIILFFLLGLAAGMLRSDLRIPAAVYDFLSIYLLLAIGLKGGLELHHFPLGSLLPKVIVVVIVLGVFLPLVGYLVLRGMGKFPRVDAAAVAAHYGSVSVGTYAIAVAYLNTKHLEFESYITLFLAVLEMPAILVGVLLARGIDRNVPWKNLLHEILTGKAVICLAGGILIGWSAGPQRLASLNVFFVDLFRGMLSLFLLEMGLICSGQISALRRYGMFLVIFGVAMPFLGAFLAGMLGSFFHLSVGGVTLLMVLGASASYIAVPAAMRLSVPEANPSLFLAVSLGVTFPFNVTVGIPLYLKAAQVFFS